MTGYRKQRVAVFIFMIMTLLVQTLFCQIDARKEVKIPDILGYRVLKCDFHTHTVFSDGDVWPSVRAKEIWLNGLDAFAITDHLEYTPHKDDVNLNFNRSYEIALPLAKSRGITLIKGAEITRDMPPGHINAIFLQDVTPLKTEKWEDAVQIAHDQGAFIFWNHPGWKAQQPDGIAKWYEQHEELYKKKRLDGIEIVNEKDYYPEAYKMGIEKNLTIMANSDVHDPIFMTYDYAKGEHRPMTLVLAKENTVEEIKKALFDGRTMVYHEKLLIGKGEYLQAVFENSISIQNPEMTLKGRERGYFRIHNSSEISYELKLETQSEEITVPEEIVLQADRTVMFSVRAKSEEISGKKKYEISYKVKNLLAAPEEGLPVILKFKIEFEKKD
jgi:hypothetical protein